MFYESATTCGLSRSETILKNRKASGYRSYHVIVEYPVDTIDGNKTVLAEIQIRTLSMNFWATIEHSLNYKYKGEFPDEIKKRLEITAKIAYQLDEEMGKFVMIFKKRKLYLTQLVVN